MGKKRVKAKTAYVKAYGATQSEFQTERNGGNKLRKRVVKQMHKAANGGQKMKVTSKLGRKRAVRQMHKAANKIANEK